MDAELSANGTSVRSEFLPFHLPDLGEEEIASVTETLRSGWLTTGPRTAEFESAFAQYIGSRYAVAVNSCTAALHLSLSAADVGPGDEVIVPTMTFAATAEVVIHLGAKPVLVDSKPDDLTVDCDDLRAALSPRTKAVIPVHYAGHPCAMDEIMEIAGEHGLAIIEDAAHPYYRDRYGYRPGDFPAATQEYARLVSLPIYTRMSESAVRQIILRHRA